MTVARKWKLGGSAASLLLALAIVPVVPLSAQQRHRFGGPAAPKAGDDFPAKTALDAQQSKLETDLAAMLEQRAQGPSPTLDFQIDMDILARWLTQQASDAPPRSAMQACAYLRAAEIQNCNAMLAPRLNGEPITAAHADGLAKLHKMTFKLPDVKDVAKLDDFCKSAAIALIAASGPLPAGMRELPSMRPKPTANNPAPQQAGPAAQPRTLVQLVNDANHASVSPALHAQLVALSSAATAAANDPAAGEEAGTLSAMLEEVMDVVTGLQTNVGVDADQRAKMEQQLTDGVALFADPRMRAAGRRRIESLDHYRQNLDRIRKLQLTPDLSAKLGPAFVFADQNPDTGNDVLDAIQKWVSLTATFDNHAAAAGLTTNESRIVDAMRKQFTTQHDGFLTDAANLNAGPSATFNTSPADLTAHLGKMQEAIDTTQLVERTNVAMTTLLTFHPRPTGGLERRVAVALAAMADNFTSPPDRLSQREMDRGDDAVRFLTDLEHLAQTAADVSTGTNGIPAAVAQNWAGGKLQDFDSKRNDLVAGLVSQAAAGKDIDSSVIDRLDRAKALVAGLHDAVAVQAGLDQTPLLTHWVDWTISPANLQTVLGPVRDATAAAVAGFIDDDDDSLHQWSDIRDHYAPLMNLVSSAGAYADQCNALPGDLIGEMAKLATPMDGQPFGDERFASLCMGLWNAFEQAQVPDDSQADAMVQALLKMGR
jgi:hypothetical protein